MPAAMNSLSESFTESIEAELVDLVAPELKMKP